jgi:hypothetical protein
MMVATNDDQMDMMEITETTTTSTDNSNLNEDYPSTNDSQSTLDDNLIPSTKKCFPNDIPPI